MNYLFRELQDNSSGGTRNGERRVERTHGTRVSSGYSKENQNVFADRTGGGGESDRNFKGRRPRIRAAKKRGGL